MRDTEKMIIESAYAIILNEVSKLDSSDIRIQARSLKIIETLTRLVEVCKKSNGGR